MAKAEPEPVEEEKVAPDTWPADWPEENRSAYFAEIVGKPMPAKSAKAFAQLQAAIAEKAQDAEPIRTNLGFSCFGIYYRPDLKQCSVACKVMPLCQRICSQRPDIRAHVDEMEQAARDLEAQQLLPEQDVSEPEEAEAPAVKPKKEKKSKAKPAKQKAGKVTYCWVGDVDAYEAVDEDSKISVEVYTWMAARSKPFTMASLIKKLGDYFEEEDCAEVAEGMLEHLLGEGDIETGSEESVAVA